MSYASNLKTMLKYSEHYVHMPLSPFVKKLWSLDNLTGVEASGERSVLPNGCFTIAVITGLGTRAKTRLVDEALRPGIYFVGQLTEAIKVDVLAHTKATMVQLFAWTPVYFCDRNMGAFTDRIVPLETVGFNLKIAAFTDTGIALAVYRSFKNSFRPNGQAHLVQQACLLLDAAPLTVSELAAGLGCSLRQIQKKFRQHIGLSPKAFSIILKLRRAVDDIAYPDQAKIALTRLALQHHFYDQAHFINTFQSIVGTSPARFDKTAYLLAYKNK